jgi:uncharacterized protein
MEYFGGAMTDEQWYEEQIRFLSAHRYWTAAARVLREARQRQYLEEIVALLAQHRLLAANDDHNLRSAPTPEV